MRLFYYFAGGSTSLMLFALLQDALGREAYMAYLRDHWIDSSPWPWVFAVIAINVLAYCMYRKEKARAPSEQNRSPDSRP